MQWDATPNAGFTTGEPWLPLAPDAQRVNVAAQRDDPGSLFSFYRRLLALRRASVALRSGSYRSLPSPRDVFAYDRAGGGERYAVALNFADRPRRVALGGSAVIALSTEGERGESAVGGGIQLAPNEGVLARLT